MFGFDRQATRRDESKGRYDPVLIDVAIALASLGVVMVASSSIAVADGQHVGPFHYLFRHLVFLALGIGLCALMMKLELEWFERNAFSLLLFAVILLLLVFAPGFGMRINGARRWVRLGIVGFQSVEAVKLMFIVYIASYLVRQRDSVQGRFFGVVKPLGVAIILVALLLHVPLSRPQFVAYSVHDLPAGPPLLMHALWKLPLLTWTVRSDEDRKRAARWADQVIFEGWRP